MKKNLIALAVLAASGVASAQSSVTLYGIADVWFGSTKTESLVAGKAVGTRQTKIDSGGVSSSRFGFKGSEDLGGGLKANFLLEQGFNIDTGMESTAAAAKAAGQPAPASQMFSRQSYVGLSSAALGEVRLGKTFTPFDDISGVTTPGFDSALSPSMNVWKSTGYNDKPNNTVYYASPSFSGVSGAASYSLGENKNATPGVAAGKTTSFNIKYAGGPVYAGLAYQTEKAAGSAPSVKFTRLNASYDLGMVKLLAGYGRVSDKLAGLDGNKTTDWQIGADVPVTSALTLSGGYAHSKDNDSINTKRTGLGLAASYSLSKRTSVYGGVQAAKTEKNGAADLKSNLYAVGVRHAF
jgi:predicted porin